MGPTEIRAVGSWKDVSHLPDMQSINGTQEDEDDTANVQPPLQDQQVQAVPELSLDEGGTEATPETLMVQTDGQWVTLGECRQAIRGLLDSLRGEEIDDQVLQRVTDEFVGTSESVERKKVGMITWRDFKVYLDAFGTRSIVTLLLVLLLIAAGLGVGSNAWLAHWTGEYVV